ncbi:MAG: FAD:protein FMN transferase [Lachnospiraceae bacterium]|nr:FAD:protein FMN transferase [Lachnospiraceae bacterium]
MKTKHLKLQSYKNKYISLLCAFCMVSVSLWGCSLPFDQNALTIRDTIIAFDTVVTITLYGTDDTDILQEAMDLCRDYDKLFSRTIPESDVYRINHANGQAVTVSPETILLIKESLFYSELTKGAVDITIAPVRDLWDFSSQSTGETVPALPDDTALSQALAHVNYQCIQYDESAGTVTLTDPEAQIDLGFIAKGYIADALKEYLIFRGITSATIDLGGNILTIGTKPDGTPFQIGIKKPFENGTPMDVLSITDQSVVTSGIYERCFQIDDVIYHHILDPETGYPVSNELLSVTIISDSSMEGDALSTTCLLLGLSKAQELISSLDGVEAVFITKDYEIIDTRL